MKVGDGVDDEEEEYLGGFDVVTGGRKKRRKPEAKAFHLDSSVSLHHLSVMLGRLTAATHHLLHLPHTNTKHIYIYKRK